MRQKKRSTGGVMDVDWLNRRAGFPMAVAKFKDSAACSAHEYEQGTATKKDKFLSFHEQWHLRKCVDVHRMGKEQ